MQVQEHKMTHRDLVITRVFDAPVALVWQAWTDPAHFKRWWGPKDFTTPVAQMDLRVGGKYLFCMRSPTGQDYWGTGVFREIVPFKRLVFTDSFADDQGNVVSSSHYGMDPTFPLETVIRVTFEEHDGKTRLTLEHIGMPVSEMGDNTALGWNESFDKLAAILN